MLKMRLQRVGRKHEPSFRVVLTDSKNSTKSGRFQEVLGSYDPRKSTDLLKIDRIKYWLSKGIQATGSVHNLFVTHKIIDAKKVNVLPKKTPIIKESSVEQAPVAASVPVETSAAAPVVEEVAPVEVPSPEVAADALSEALPEENSTPTAA